MKFDGSLGRSDALSGPNFLIPAEAGKQVGGNLFHSFSRLDLNAGEIANFRAPIGSGAPGVANILARVTGGTPSSIDGTLRSEMSGANLFLINSAGVMFGTNASLDISGSFAVTTADHLVLADGAHFDARPGANDLMLTAAPVNAFGFTSARPAAVTFNGSRLATLPGRDFTIAAGDVSLDGTTVSASSGSLAIVSMAGPGVVPSSADAIARASAVALPAIGTVTMKSGSSGNIDGAGGGRIVLRGGSLQLEGGSTIQSKNTGSVKGGDVDARLAQSVTIHDGQIRANALGAGNGGNVSVDAPSISIDGEGVVLFPGSESYNGIGALVAETGTGNGGNVNVRAEDLTITTRGSISASTFGHGDGGRVEISATNISIDGRSSEDTGIYASVLAGAVGNGGDIRIQSSNLTLAAGGAILSNVLNGATGHGGNINIGSDSLSVLSGSQISSNIFGSGNGGGIRLVSEMLLIDGLGDTTGTGVFAGVGKTGIGHGGDVAIEVNRLSIFSGGQIASNTQGVGGGGAVHIGAGTLQIDGMGNDDPTGIFATVQSTAKGNGGKIGIHADQLLIGPGGRISADTRGQGNGGSLRVDALEFSIDGSGTRNATGISANVRETGIGRGGNIAVTVARLQIKSADISASLFGIGTGGDVSVHAKSIRVEQFDGSASSSGIFSDVQDTGKGNSGNVTVVSDELRLLGDSVISAQTSGQGSGGDIRVHSGVIRIDGVGGVNTTGIQSTVEDGAIGNGGKIFVASRDMSITGGGVISAETFGRGDGGEIHVKASKLHIDALEGLGVSGIFADVGESGIGGSGNVHVEADEITIGPAGQISAETFGKGNSGNISISAGKFSIDGQGYDYDTGIFSDVNVGAVGNGGVIDVTAGKFQLFGSAVVSASVFGHGIGGDIHLEADQILLDNHFSTHDSGILARLGGSGRGGSISIRGGDLIIGGGSVISATTSGRGDGGSIAVAVDDLSLDGRNLNFPNGIFARVNPDGSGHGGKISITAHDISIVGGSQISTETLGRGNGGDVKIAASLITLDRKGRYLNTISAGVRTGAVGNGGNILIESGRINILGGSEISANTAGLGDGGNISIDAGSVSLAQGGRLHFNGIAARVSEGGIGEGGSIRVRAKELLITDGSAISATTFGDGTGGDIAIESAKLRITAADVSNQGGIFANSHSDTGSGGTIDVYAGILELSGRGSRIAASAFDLGSAGSIRLEVERVNLFDGALVTVSSDRSNAGAIEVNAHHRIEIVGGSTIAASAAMSGGNITLTAPDFISIDHSTVAATAGSVRLAEAGGGAGGNITIDPEFLILDHATISANAAVGRGGNIRLEADNFFTSESSISATGLTAGTVEVVAPELDLANGLASLPVSLIDASVQLRDQCAARLGLDFSSILVLGRGGAEIGPDEAPAIRSATRRREKVRLPTH